MDSHQAKPLGPVVARATQHLMAENAFFKEDLNNLLCGLITLDVKLPKEVEKYAADIVHAIIQRYFAFYVKSNVKKTERFLNVRGDVLDILQSHGHDYTIKQLAIHNLLKDIAQNSKYLESIEQLVAKGWVWSSVSTRSIFDACI